MKRDEIKKGMFITLASGKSFKVYRGLFDTPAIIVNDDILHLLHVVDDNLNPTIEDFKIFIMNIFCCFDLCSSGPTQWPTKFSVLHDQTHIVISIVKTDFFRS